MEYLLSFLLLGLNLFDYEYNINQLLFFVVGTVLIIALFAVCYKKTKDVLCSCVMLMCHTWQISWINIFGDPTEKLQLPWFYIIGAVVLFFAIVKIPTLKDRPVNALVLGIFVTLCVVSVYPLLISPSLMEGLKEFIMIIFFVILAFIAFLCHGSMSKEQREHVIKAYICAVVLSSLFIVVQYVSYSLFNRILFKFSLGNYNGIPMTSANLLMEDTSCSTIMLGTGVFYMLERINEKKHVFVNVLFILLTVMSLGLTSRRTSIISLVICFVFYVPLRYKGIMKKLTMMTLLFGAAVLMILYLIVARPVEDYGQYLDSNGRFENYLLSIGLFLEHPLGIGYDNVELVNQLNSFEPHNTVLRWLNMAGIVFTLLMLTVLAYILYAAFKKKLTAELWALVYVLIAMNFIPDILNARFFVIICMMVLLSVPHKKSELSSRDSVILKNIRKNKVYKN